MKVTRDESYMYLPVPLDYQGQWNIEISAAEEQWIYDTFARMHNVQDFIREKINKESSGGLAAS